MPKLKIAVIGLGYWGPKLVRIFQSMDDVSVVCLCDIKQDLVAQLSGKFNIPHKGVTDYHRLFDDQSINCDAVIIATPPSTHYKIAKDALLAGKHVFVEKPLATNSRHAYELCRIAQKKGLILFVDHTFCYDEILLKVRDVAQAKIGGIRFARYDWHGARQKNKGPDVLWDSGPHAFASSLFIADKPVQAVQMKIAATLENGTPSAMIGSIYYQGDQVDQITIAWRDQVIEGTHIVKTSRVTLVGKNSSIVYEGNFNERNAYLVRKQVEYPEENDRFELTVKNDELTEKDIIPSLPYASEPLKDSCRSFVRSATGDKPAMSDTFFPAKVVEILEAADTSSKNGAKLVCINRQKATALKYFVKPILTFMLFLFVFAHVWGIVKTAKKLPENIGNFSRNISRLPVKSHGEPFKFAVIGDVENGIEVFEKALTIANQRGADFVVLCGDIVHNTRKRSGEELFSFFMHEFAETQFSNPVFTVIGNHDILKKGVDKYKGFNRYFGPHNFSFFYCDNLFILLDNNGGITDDTLVWLQGVLQKDAGKVKEIFLFGHEQFIDPKSLKDGIPGEITNPRLKELLLKYGVRFLINSHLHSYRRLQLDGGILNITTGGGGGNMHDNFPHHFVEITVYGNRINDEVVVIPSNTSIENFEQISKRFLIMDVFLFLRQRPLYYIPIVVMLVFCFIYNRASKVNQGYSRSNRLWPF